MKLQIKRQDIFPKEYEEVLFKGLCDEAAKAKGMSPMHSFSLFLLDDHHHVLGGLKALIHYGCLYVSMLWVDEKIRHQGWGLKLMTEAERVAKESNASFMTLTTMDWEALPFYQKLGFKIEFVREGYEKQSKMFSLRKDLD